MPSAAPRPCTFPGCRAYAIKGGRCTAHAHPSGWTVQKDRGTAAERGYGARWRKTRQRILERDCHLCQVCKAEGRLTYGTEVDHIVPKSEGGGDGYANLQAICKPCHARKTTAEAARGRGVVRK